MYFDNDFDYVVAYGFAACVVYAFCYSLGYLYCLTRKHRLRRNSRKELLSEIAELRNDLNVARRANWERMLLQFRADKQLRFLRKENDELKRVNAIHVDVAKQLDNDIEELRIDLRKRNADYKLLWSYYVSLCGDYYVAKSKLSRKPKNKAA